MIVNKKKINLPTPIMVTKKTNMQNFKKALLAGASKIQAKIIANRDIPDYVKIKDILNPSLKNLDIYKLSGIKKSAIRIADAIEKGETIGLLCDFDVDGISSAAVLYSSFIDYFNYDPLKIKLYISNRMKAGYGFSEEVLDRVVNDTPIASLLMTADQGSKDGMRVGKYNEIMKEKGLVGDVIITDHHHIDGNGPSEAYSVVNPHKTDCKFEDNTICGCTVALFVMVAVREELIKRKLLPEDAPRLNQLLTFSTAATISDCVSMASPINRAIVLNGLKDINLGTKASWRVFKNLEINQNKPIRTDTIGFGFGPIINACSRTGGNGLVAVKYYLAENEKEAQRYLDMLMLQNEDRKKKEKELVLNSIVDAANQYNTNNSGLCIYLENGHHGIHGIAASRICEKFGAPVVIFSPKDYEEYQEEVEREKIITKMIDGRRIKEKKMVKEKLTKKNVFTITGSARSVDSIDIHETLVNIDKANKDIFIGFGGHSMAAGMSMNLDQFENFKELFQKDINSKLPHREANPVIHIDGELKEGTVLDLNFVDELLRLEPYGNGFDYPIFKMKAHITSIEIKGKGKDTGIFQILFGGNEYKGIWFKYDQSIMFNQIHKGDHCELAVQVRDNFFRGKRTISIQILHANKI
jgi:single-stranded-DNA-specific exonuclease